MSTNYYAKFLLTQQEKDIFKVFDVEEPKLHIGKSTPNWQFLFRGYKEKEVYNCPELLNINQWAELLYSGKVEVLDKYGSFVPVGELITLIQSKQSEPNSDKKWVDSNSPMHSNHYWLDNRMYNFTNRYFS